MDWVVATIIISIISAIFLKQKKLFSKQKYRTGMFGSYLKDYPFFLLLVEFAIIFALSMFALVMVIYFIFFQRSIIFTPLFILLYLLILMYLITLYQELQTRKKDKNILR